MISLDFVLKFAKNNWKLLVIAGVILAVLWYHWSAVREARKEGYASAITAINKAAQKLETEADEAASTVEECSKKGEPWIWNRETHKCVR